MSPRGCRVVTERPLAVGALVRLTLSAERLAEPLVLAGQVVWAEPGRPARAGISFAGTGTMRPTPEEWVRSLESVERPLLEILVAPPEPHDADPAALSRRLGDRAEELLGAGQPRFAALLARRALALAPGDARLEALLARAGAPEGEER